MRLVIYDRNYSSWSMRAGLALRLTGASFTEVAYQTAPPSEQAALKRRSPTGLFPVLEDGDARVWDSLAIVEHVAERFPDARLWPADPAARSLARSVSAEMHSGFLLLRQQMPMNIRARYARFPRQPELGPQIDRVTAIWRMCLESQGNGTERSGGDFLFGAFGAVDCMFAPVVMRLRTYDVGLDPIAEKYARAIEAHPAVADWVRLARDEGYTNEKYDLVTG